MTANYPCREECTLGADEIIQITEDVLSSDNFKTVNSVFTDDLRYIIVIK